MSDEVTDFRIEVAEADLEDLRARLRHTRWPERETVEDWSQGVPLAYLEELCQYWADGYDWRATERRLNALPQFRTVIDGIGIHFLEVRSPHADALPLVITHGWPGSIIEFLKVLGPLTDPTAHGGAASDAFHVVCPSLPGYGFSDRPARPGWGVERIAGAWAALMARLGYERYGAQGSDWGTSISASIGQQDADRVAGIHLTPPLAPPDPATFDDLTERERAALASLEHSAEWDSGYSREHATRPQTIGYALVDSPAALCAWIIEKFWAWTDCDGRLENVLTRDELLGQPHALLAAGHGRLFRAPVLGEQQARERVDLRTHERHGHRPHRLHDLPQGAPAPVATLGGEALCRHPLLERARPGWALRRLRATGAVRRRTACLLSTGSVTRHRRPDQAVRKPRSPTTARCSRMLAAAPSSSFLSIASRMA
jgi:pimeloyl-ACP methyl ester carboxylesterase